MVERVGHGPAGSAQDDAHEEVPDREERAARQLIMTLADKPEPTALSLPLIRIAVLLASSSTSVEWAAVARRPCSIRTGTCPPASSAPPQLTTMRWSPCENSNASVEAQPNRAWRGRGGGAASNWSTLRPALAI